MPEAEEKKRGGVERYRTLKLPGGKYVHIAVVPVAGPEGGHTIVGPVHEEKHEEDDK